MEGSVMKNAVLVDIDGTLVEVTPNWNMERDLEWVAETLTAKVHVDAVEMVHSLKEQGFVIVVLTARGQSCKKNTWKKFREIGIADVVDSVWHRPVAWNNVPSVEYKEAMIKRLLRKYNFVMAMEDEDRNIAMMEKYGMKIWKGQG